MLNNVVCLFIFYVVVDDVGCEAGIPLKLDLYSTLRLNWLVDIYSILKQPRLQLYKPRIVIDLNKY